MDPKTQLNAALEGRYRIERELGEGGMATVYLAADLKHDRQVAIKTIGQRDDPAAAEVRFQREVRIAATLNHPHILTLHDSGEAAGLRYYVMPYVAGESLRSRLERDGPIDVSEAIRLCGEVGEALDYAHRAGIVHRDIKPDNIMLFEGHATVADFGIASAHEAPDTLGLTLTGDLVGTPAYLSPEQVNGGKVDGRSDLYSLACVLFECLTGSLPFTGTPLAVMAQRVIGNVPTVRSHRADIPETLARVIERAMAIDPERRFPTGQAFSEALGDPDSAHVMPERQGIVVLPFTNLSPDPENEFFSDGLTEEIISDLSSIRVLRVISRTSAMQLKDTSKDVRTIGRELGVRYVLEGGVRRAGSQLRITAQLIDAEGDEQLWSKRYGGTIDDVFEVQERVARDIVGALDLTLTSSEERRLSDRPIADARAFELYLRARQELRRYGPAIQRGLDLIHRAKEIEGETIPLRALEATGKITLLRSGHATDQVDLEEIRSEAVAILTEAPELAAAHGLLGYLANQNGLNADAVRHVLAALDRDPNDTDMLFILGVSYIGGGQNDAARATADRMVASDPLSSETWMLACAASWFVGRAEEGLAAGHRILELDPGHAMGHWITGYTHALVGEVAEAKEHAEGIARSAPDMLYTGQLLGLVAALEGDAAGALAHVENVEGYDGHHEFHLAEVFAMAGDHDRAMDLLEKSVDSFHPADFIRDHSPFLAPLRGTSRFEAYAARAEELTAKFGTSLT